MPLCWMYRSPAMVHKITPPATHIQIDSSGASSKEIAVTNIAYSNIVAIVEEVRAAWLSISVRYFLLIA